MEDTTKVAEEVAQEETQEIVPDGAEEETQEVSSEQEDVSGEQEIFTPKKKTAQERINELTRLRREAEREAEYWRKKAGPEKPEPITQAPTGRPKQENFDTIEQYEDALLSWHDSKKELTAKQIAAQKRETEALATFNKNAKKMRETYEDFDEVTSAEVYTDTMRNAIFDLDNGPLIAYHLGRNPDIAIEIGRLSPERQVYEIAKLENQLLLAQKTKKTTGAPAPINPVGSTGKPEVDDRKLTTEEWMEREKQRRLEKIKQRIGG